MIYLDNNATTALAPEVINVMEVCLRENFGNPSSAHIKGTETKKLVAEARRSVAEMLGAREPNEIVFTSGGTESDNWAIFGAAESSPTKKHVITTLVEHEAVRRPCERLEKQGFKVTWLEVGEDGSLNLDQLGDSLDENTAVVSVMMANNETGVIFPVQEIAELVHEKSNALFHVDGVNAAGKIKIDLKNTEIDLFSVSAHKFHGPKGIGALYVRDGCLPSMLIGGGQESGQRAGTEAVHQIVGIGTAAEFVKGLAAMEGIRELRDHFENEIINTIPKTYINGDPNYRLPNTSNISFDGVNGEMILARLDEIGVCVSTGSACNSETHTASPVLQAMNIPYNRAMGSIRFSLCRFNKIEEIELVLAELPNIISLLREIAG